MPAYVKSVKYSETPTSILMQNAQYARQEQMLLQKAAADDRKARQAIPVGLADKLKNLDADVINNDLTYAIDDLVQKSKDKSVSTSDLSSMSARYLAKIASKSQAVKQFKADIDEGLKGIDTKFGINKGLLQDAAAAHLAFNINDVKSLGTGFDFIEKSMSEPSLFVSREIGVPVIQSIIKTAPKFNQSEVITKDATGNMKLVSGYETKLAPWYRMKEVKDPNTGIKTYRPELKLSTDGAIDEGVFNMFYNFSGGDKDFRVKMTIDAGAQDIIRKKNEANKKKPGDEGFLDEKDAGVMELAKRSYLTEILKTSTAPEFKVTSTVDRAAPKAPRASASEKAGEDPAIALERYNRFLAATEGRKPGLGGQINLLERSDQDYAIKAASDALGREANASEFDLIKLPDGRVALRAAADLRSSDNKIIFKKNQPLVVIGKAGTDYAEAKEIGGITEAKKVAKRQAAKAPSPAATKKEVKRSDIDAFAKKSGYSYAEYVVLLKKNGVKIIE